MKKSELKKLIQEIAKEIINEADISPEEKAAKDAELKALAAKKKAIDSEINNIKTGKEKVAEEKLNEMAWGVKGNKLQYFKKTSLEKETEIPERVTPKQKEIINILKQKEGEIVTDKEIQDALNLARPQMVNNQLSTLFIGAPSVAPEIPKGEPGAEPEVPEEEDELAQLGVVSGELSDEEIEASFAKAKAAGKEEEPEIEDIEGISAADTMSDEDYNAFMKYTELKARLNGVKGDLNRMKRAKFAAGEFDDKSSTEEKRLRDLKKSLEDRVNTLLAGSEYLQRREKEAEAKKAKEEPLDEWVKSKLQYYAGITK